MGNIISLLQEIFMMKEDNRTKVGLADFRDIETPVEQPAKKKPQSSERIETFRIDEKK